VAQICERECGLLPANVSPDCAIQLTYVAQVRYPFQVKYCLLLFCLAVLRIRMGYGAFLTPGSGIRNRLLPGVGSRIPDPKSIFLRT
jgi:hypothetical protein